MSSNSIEIPPQPTLANSMVRLKESTDSGTTSTLGGADQCFLDATRARSAGTAPHAPEWPCRVSQAGPDLQPLPHWLALFVCQSELASSGLRWSDSVSASGKGEPGNNRGRFGVKQLVRKA